MNMNPPMSSSYKKLLVIVVGLLVSVVLLVASGLFDVIKIEWVSFMELQPSYRPMEEPLPVATGSIPVDGPAFIGGTGDPMNPLPTDADSMKNSVERGRLLYSVTCIQCHGVAAKGDGNVGFALQNKPADLTGDVVRKLSDGAIFLTITNGKIVNDQVRMPALNENLTVRDRWDLVNFIRSLQAAASLATATPKP